ncbi:pyridoxal phosphate phosphatase [Drosophila eugracilis]|uniref:pyridoxal phosphate phosphatase n=1 Tax=Drosophila eugracilis TaxID=29029 RepID=UPI0007E6C679|nr:pyridoxal phosphate phosphatase [Drosophila eugracilis]
MFRRSLSLLDKLPKAKVAEWLGGIDTIICSPDGVLWQGNTPVEGSVEAFNAIQSKGKRSLIVTNSCCLTKSDLVTKAKCLGFKIKDQDVLSSSAAISSYLADRKFKKKLFVLGGEGIRKDLKEAGFCSEVSIEQQGDRNKMQFVRTMALDPDVGAVLVAKDDRMEALQMLLACNYLQNPKVLFLTTSLDGYQTLGKRRVPDGGGIANAIEVIVMRKPTVLGKPNPRILGKLIESGEIKPEKSLVIGNSLMTDIAFANICGFQSLLVDPDNKSFKEAEKIIKEGNEKKMILVPDTYLPSLGSFLEFLCTEVKPEKEKEKKTQERRDGLKNEKQGEKK